MSSVESSSLEIDLDPGRDNYAVMGNPIAHSKSPIIHTSFAEQTNQLISYQAIHVPEGQFASAVQQFRELSGKGLNITVPYKQDAYHLCNNLTIRAQAAMAVNTLWFGDGGQISGDNTDGVGLLRDLLNNHIQVQGSKILIIGAGGAVRGILGPLSEQQPKSILIANRTLNKAVDLASSIQANNISACGIDTLENKGNFDVIINGTSSGLKGELPPLPTSIISKDTCCYDMVYGDTETVFNQWCKEHGASKALDGLGMLVEQAAESFFIWRGVKPTSLQVINMLRKDLMRK
jgi:shikimate dehydrogenase